MQRLQHTPCTPARLLFSARADFHFVSVFHAAGGAMRTHARDDGFVNEQNTSVAAVCILSLVLQNLFVLFLLLCPVSFNSKD